jgi:predicted metalloprotease with PDZ domain
VFGEYPDYEPGHYTFLADYLPYASDDGMEHRNSTVVTNGGSIRTNRRSLLESIAHEFFHAWNVERIRPRSIEPFDLEHANMSGELWLAEGFTQYYGPVTLQRAGLADLSATCLALTEFVETVTLGPGRAFRSAEAMSRMAPFTDGGATADRTNWENTYISYYPFGGAIALGLDLALRERSDSRITLDDFMRAMWREHGKPGGRREGYVDRPYTAADAEARLAEVSGDRAFARDFFSRYIQGREIVNYPQLLAAAGLVVRKRRAGRAWWGDVRIEPRGGHLLVTALVDANSPAYAAGLEHDDEIREIDGIRVGSATEASSIISRHRPGDRLGVTYVDRTGVEKMTTVALVEDPHLQVVPVETEGRALTPEQRTFRERWLR